MAIVKKGFIVEGTTCDACEKIIKRQVMKVHGVQEVEFDLETETGFVTFNDKKTNLDAILSKIEEVPQYTGFILTEKNTAKEQKSGISYGWIIAAAGLLIAAYSLFGFVDRIAIPDLSQNFSYGVLFVVGLLTGFHCIGMCGPFVVSYTAKDAQAGRKSHFSHLLYGGGKLLSYTVIGALFGLLGSFIAFTPTLRGAIGILAGIFLVFYGVKMLNLIPALRKVHFGLPNFIGKHVHSKTNKGPFVIGLLNGLMIACGPLLAVYILAAGTGSAIEGAKLLFIFGVGTLPVMLGFGYFLSFLSGKATHNILKFSGALVIVLGLIMLNTGLALTGSGYDYKTLKSSLTQYSGSNNQDGTQNIAGNIAVQKDGYQEIRMDVTRYGWEPDTFVLKKGVPVKWIINGKEITGCNRAIQVPKYGLEFDIKQGEQIIEFTPTESSTVPWSCWMGMIPGTFIVKDDISASNVAAIQQDLASAPKPAAGGCGCGGGAATTGGVGTCGAR